MKGKKGHLQEERWVGHTKLPDGDALRLARSENTRKYQVLLCSRSFLLAVLAHHVGFTGQFWKWLFLGLLRALLVRRWLQALVH